MKLEESFIKSLNETTFLWIVLFGLNAYIDSTNKLRKVIIISSVYVGGITLINYMKKDDDDHKKELTYDYHYY